MSYPNFTPAHEKVELFPGDILLVAGTGWVSKRIIKASQEKHELPSRVSHVGLITVPGTIRTAIVTEAQDGHVRSVPIDYAYLNGAGMTVARPLNIPSHELEKIVETITAKEGEKYGYGDIFLHLLWRTTGLELWRRLVSDRKPICSHLLDLGFRSQGYSFGTLSPQPDDIDDFARAHPDRYSWPLGPELRSLRW